PSTPATLADTVRAYYRRMQALADDVLRVMALALDVPQDFFRPYFVRHANVMRVLHYPEQRRHAPRPGETRSGAHTDYGALTLLLPDPQVGGLQVRLRHGEWS